MTIVEHFNQAILYIEANLTNEISYDEIARIATCSKYHFQRMFAFLTSIPLSEYIRCRRLTLAAYDLQNTDIKIIDVASKYGYRSADAFSRAFQKMHGVLPSDAKKEGTRLKSYASIQITLSVQGFCEMTYRIEKKAPFNILGIKERLSYVENLGQKVGEMWQKLTPATISDMLTHANSGELIGVYSQMYEDDTTDYYIGVITNDIEREYSLLEVPEYTWAVFDIVGPLPNKMAKKWEQIHNEWFMTMDYEYAYGPEIEWYSIGDNQAEDYKSEIWIPVIPK